ncbi:MAG TPA: type II toxin-antitoxin system VapC family toxin [Meiothermus sp.]|nr:type II toxin-antitoxin system VapC family toxin [Meiothermus sp.]
MSVPPRLVLDAGPPIALYHAADPDHESTVRGFGALAQAKSRLIVPLPVGFWVFKWLLFEGGPDKARLAPDRMREGLEVIALGLGELDAIQTVLQALLDWKGALEDASVALLVLRLGVPLRTLSYRDLGIFPKLEFWAG